MDASFLLRHRKCLVVSVFAIAPLLSGCKIAQALFFPETETEYERDIEFRGAGSQEAWLNATGGTYNGNLPRE